jgi:hypothetical protein
MTIPGVPYHPFISSNHIYMYDIYTLYPRYGIFIFYIYIIYIDPSAQETKRSIWHVLTAVSAVIVAAAGVL